MRALISRLRRKAAAPQAAAPQAAAPQASAPSPSAPHERIETFLTKHVRLAGEPRFGRNLHDGYVRGSGLAYGALAPMIRAEQDFQEALQPAMGRTICAEHRILNLYLLIRFYLPKLEPGHIIEFGCYKGGSAMFMASLAKRYLPGTVVYGLDTFEGMPDTDTQIDLHVRGNFSDVDFESLNTCARSYGLRNLRFVKGLFEDTAPSVLVEAGKFTLAHIDCDIQSAVLYSWGAVKSHMVPGGYVVFDDATEASCLSATEAIERELIQKERLCSEQIYPHYVFRYPPVRPLHTEESAASALKAPTAA